MNCLLHKQQFYWNFERCPSSRRTDHKSASPPLELRRPRRRSRPARPSGPWTDDEGDGAQGAALAALEPEAEGVLGLSTQKLNPQIVLKNPI